MSLAAHSASWDEPLPFACAAVREWFESRYPAGPTEPQARAWPSIIAGENTLVAAPTGSGKTLAAFLVHLDRLFCDAAAGTLGDGIEVVYVSPLKALVADIAENLERPLREIREIAERRGEPLPEVRVAMRSGDSTQGARNALVKRPPHILVTTPESLYLLVTAEKSRALLGGVKSIIVDEIHALARDKRGVHLALTLERLAALCERRPARIGLSATQRPLPAIARLLVGNAVEGSGPVSCRIIDEGHQRELDLGLELPDTELEAVASTEQILDVVGKIAAHVKEHKTTLVFVNTRRLSERLAHHLADVLGEGVVAAHHGSLSKDRRLAVEARLREGQLRALVATASLELGIDIGPIELVCQVGSPRSIATFLQRVGRSGHARFKTPKGRLYPLTRDELCECAALLRAVRAGRLDQVVMPVAPLDILAQQIVAECGAEAWNEDELFALVRRAAPYAELSREHFDEVVDLLERGIDTGRGKRAAFLHRDRVAGRVLGRRGARLAALTSGGAIPDNADYRVVEAPGDTFVGTINEDFAIESMAGDVFLLGSTSWRIQRVQMGLVRVENAHGAQPTIPFWLGEAPARTLELSEEVSTLRAVLDDALDRGDLDKASARLEADAGLGTLPARAVVEYLGAARESLGVLPTQHDLVFERFFDDSGGMQVVLHSPHGGRINRGLGLLLRKRFCRSFDFELQAAANDDSVVLSLGSQHSFPLEDLRDFLSPKGVEQALTHAVLVTPMFQSRWRWNLNRALIVLRRKGARKNPPQFQRMEADDVMASVFPALAACQDNATGPREIPDHPIVRQTLHDCLTEAMDKDGLIALLEAIERGEVRLHFRDTTEASVLAHEILNGRPYTFLDDAPLEERRTRAVQLRRGLPLQARELSLLDSEAIARVKQEAATSPRDAEELHDFLGEFVVLRPEAAWERLFLELQGAGRAGTVETARGTFWFAAEARDAVTLLFPEARQSRVADVPRRSLDRDAILRGMLRAHLDALGPTTSAELATRVGLSASEMDAPLRELEAEGFVLRGRFDPSLDGEQVCSRRLLSRIHGYTQARLRREIEPVSAQDYLRFLFEFHGVTRGHERRGPGGVLAAIEQLQGFEAAASSWEAELLPARVKGFAGEQLDSLCWGGDVVWGRLSLRAKESDPSFTTVGRRTPITLAVRDDFPWLLKAVRGESLPEPSRDARVLGVSEALERRGALFFTELLQATELPSDELEDALWDHVARGLLTSDGFAALRSLLQAREQSGPKFVHYARRGLRREARRVRSREGRWALIRAEAAPASDELAEAVALQLLARYGVVFWDVTARESFSVPWRDVVWALRRLEARGEIRGGRFVNGFVGEQYALPDAVAQLREVRRRAPSGERVTLSACDPLNLAGIVVPGPRVAAQGGNVVVFRDGVVEVADCSAVPTMTSSG